MGWSKVFKFIAHSKNAIQIAIQYGWLPAARYTNLRDVKSFNNLGFLDIDWKDYDFKSHLDAAIKTKPFLTVARDIEHVNKLPEILDQAYELKKHCKHVILVPKDKSMEDSLDYLLPDCFLLGFSVPTKYGGTTLDPKKFHRPVHLLGGRPDAQRRLAEMMPVFSLDCNRFTLDASYGDYFDGEKFRKHPQGGYRRCIEDSIININKIWYTYDINSRSN